MASISADSFELIKADGPHLAIILYDHSRKRRTRRFFLYIEQTDLQVLAKKDTSHGNVLHQTRMPRKMAFALYLAYMAARRDNPAKFR